MKIGSMNVTCPFESDANTLALTGVLGAAHAAAMVIAPKKVNDKLFENPNSNSTVQASTRMTGCLAGAAALTALALSQKEDAGVARRLALTAQGAALVGVSAIQGMETKDERMKKRIGWASTAVHGTVGLACLYRGLKDGFGK